MEFFLGLVFRDSSIDVCSARSPGVIIGEVSSLDALRRAGCASLSEDDALELVFTSFELEGVCNRIVLSG